MKQKNEKPKGHSIVTYQVRLYDRHFSWLVTTQELYQKVVLHFVQVLELEQELLEQTDFLLLRELEAKCIGTKEMKAAGKLPKYPLNNFPKIPLYFRRSAINAAISLTRKRLGQNLLQNVQDGNDLDVAWLKKPMNRKEEKSQEMLRTSMTLYKGMYQNFTDSCIELKLFNGEKWVWVKYPFTGRNFPREAERLSPILVLEKDCAFLHVPFSFEVEDIRTIKERMQEEERICAVSFPDNDVLAVAVILSKDGREEACRFFRGGKRKEHQRKVLLAKLSKSQKSRGILKRNKILQETIENDALITKELREKDIVLEGKENAILYEKMQELNHYYAHHISKQILEFCQENEIRIIVVPNYEKSIDFRQKQYLKTDSYRWIGRSMIKNLKYKAFQKGIIVTSIRPCHISDTCSKCGEKIRKYNEGHTAGIQYHGGKLFLCPNGHKGNSGWNAARNIGKIFLSYYLSQ